MEIIDVSSNNHHYSNGEWDPLDFSSDLFQGVYIKVGQGSKYNNQMYFNPCLLSDYTAAKAAGKLVGFYWFYDIGWPVYDQVVAFYKAIKDLVNELVPVLDYEVGVPSKEIISEWNQYSVVTTMSYMDQYFASQINSAGSLVWLAIPGWTVGQQSIYNPAMVQYGQVTIPGLPNGLTDISHVIDKEKVLVPIPPYNSALGTVVTTSVEAAPVEAVPVEAAPVVSTATNTPSEVGAPDPTDAPIPGTLGNELPSPIVACASVPSMKGSYYLVSADGTVYAFGSAIHYGSVTGPLNKPICGMMVEDPQGYALVAEDGGVITFGDFQFQGSI